MAGEPDIEKTSPTTRPPGRFFFVHVQKTAGTSVFLRLQRVFPPEAIYPDQSDGDTVIDVPQLAVDQLLDRWAVRGDEIGIVTGHFPLCTAELLGGGFTSFTVLREPVERTLSYLRHHCKLTAEDRDKPLEAIYEDPFRFEGLIHNHMVKMFSLTPETMTGGMLTKVDFTPEHLERAKAQLGTVAVVGLQERFDEFWRDVERTFSWDLGKPAFSNRTEPVDVDDAFRRRIAEDNALDVEFYEHARELVSTRLGT
jgi:hypothetical protein